MFCHQCGAAIEGPDDRFCSRCGAQLHREDESGSETRSPPAEAPVTEAERHRPPISAWPNRPRERIQLPLTELRQRRARETGEAIPLPFQGSPLSPEPPIPAPVPSPAPVEETVPEPVEELELLEPGDETEELSTSRSRAEAALLRMVPPKEFWATENQPGPAERGRVRDEWPAKTAPVETKGEEILPAEAPPAPAQAEAPLVEDSIIPWLESPVLPAEPPRPAPPSREARAEEGPIIVPRDYDENAIKGRKGRRRAPAKARGPLFDPAALGRSIKPSWILAIAGVILLTLIVFAMFPPGGGSGGNETGTDRINKFTGMPVHTVSTPVRPTGGAGNETIGVSPVRTVGTPARGVPAVRAWATTTPRPSSIPVPGVTNAPTSTVTGPAVSTTTTVVSGAPGIQVVIASTGGWSGTIGQQGETYTETPVAGRGTQTRAITGPARMVTVNLQKLEATTDSLEVRVERDGTVLKQGSTTDPSGIVALSVEV